MVTYVCVLSQNEKNASQDFSILKDNLEYCVVLKSTNTPLKLIIFFI